MRRDQKPANARAVLLAAVIVLEPAEGGEGVGTARAAVKLAEQVGVELPIAREVARVLFEGKPLRQAIDQLMERSLKSETWS